MAGTDIKVRLIGESADRRANKWEVTCSHCKKAFSPFPTMLRHQIFDCHYCGAPYAADWNEEKVYLRNGT